MNLPKRFKTLYMKSSQTRKRKIEGITESAIMQEEKTILGKKKLFTIHLSFEYIFRKNKKTNTIKLSKEKFPIF